jgi:hypothetical protein
MGLYQIPFYQSQSRPADSKKGGNCIHPPKEREREREREREKERERGRGSDEERERDREDQN